MEAINSGLLDDWRKIYFALIMTERWMCTHASLREKLHKRPIRGRCWWPPCHQSPWIQGARLLLPLQPITTKELKRWKSLFYVISRESRERRGKRFDKSRIRGDTWQRDSCLHDNNIHIERESEWPAVDESKNRLSRSKENGTLWEAIKKSMSSNAPNATSKSHHQQRVSKFTWGQNGDAYVLEVGSSTGLAWARIVRLEEWLSLVEIVVWDEDGGRKQCDVQACSSAPAIAIAIATQVWSSEGLHQFHLKFWCY